MAGFEQIPARYREALERRGLTNQKQIDSLPVQEAREVIRLLISEVDDARAGSHPLGAAATPSQDHHTEPIRDALAGCLRLFFDDALANRVSSSTDALVGLELDKHFVSVLEIDHALGQLARVRPDLRLIVDLLYKRNWGPKKVARRMRTSDDTVHRQRKQALDMLVDIIWRDVGGKG